jgi:hypothetical protein
MSENASDGHKSRLDDVPTPDWSIPGVTDLSTLSEGDTITLACRATPLTVEQVGVRDISLATGDTARQYAVAATCDRTGTTFELIEQINIADGSTIEIVDDRGSPVRVFRGVQDE